MTTARYWSLSFRRIAGPLMAVITRVELAAGDEPPPYGS